MNRNTESHFSQIPQVDIQRSRFDRSNSLKTTFNAGLLIPIYCEEVLPGDTVTMDMSQLVRMSTPIFPTMDNSYIDTYFFYVPNRLVWDHWKEFNGENTNSYWSPSIEYNVPLVTAPLDSSGVGSPKGWDKGSLADYFGIPTEVPLNVSALPFRAYTLIWNEWFRDQNTMSPAYFTKGDNNIYGERLDAYPVISGNPTTSEGQTSRFEAMITTALRGVTPLPVSKYHDYFTSALPAPQKGPAVDIPLFNDQVEVSTVGDGPLRWSPVGTTGTFTGNNLQIGNPYGSSGDISFVQRLDDSYMQIKPSNLVINDASIASATINQLRQAFQVQRLLEKDARGGTRYRELLRSHFGVTSPDATQQVPEYLGGKRVPINIDQVLQTSATDPAKTDMSPQGNTAGFSLTTDKDSMFTKSFTEHGYLIGLACVRTNHTYQQGLSRMWSRTKRFDFYWPALANLGEQAILKKEIFATGTAADDEAFGYQEAWADYRYKPSQVTGAFRSNVNGSLDSWHYADYYDPENVSASTFVVQAPWMIETSANIDRTLAVQSSLEDQFLCDFYFKSTWTRPMPVYSVPGLIDHN